MIKPYKTMLKTSKWEITMGITAGTHGIQQALLGAGTRSLNLAGHKRSQ